MLSDRDDFFGNMKWRNWISRMPRILAILLIPITHGCSTLAGPIDPPSWISSSGNVTETLDNSTVESGSSTPEAEAGARKSDDELQLTQTAAELEQNQPISKADPLSYTEKGQQFLRRLSGQQAGNTERAKQWYQRANEIFDQAAAEKSELAKKTFEQAAELFAYAGDISPGSALQQDALFMRGESLFFADRLVEASDVYETLQSDFPRNRHIDKVAARLFSISQYWINVAKAEEGSWGSINLTDPKRPRLDTQGHAIRVLDQIRFDDPTGRLADDATLAAAVEYIRQGQFQEADEFLLDIRETFPDSEHLFMAHLLGITVKLETYRGPKYSGLALEEAEKLVKQTRERFPDKLAAPDQDFGERLDSSAAKVAFLQAERLRYRAEYREKRKEFGSARYYYNLLLTKYPDTPHAEKARERLAATEKKPRKPAQRLSWLTTIFPDSTNKNSPLELNQSTSEEPSKVLRR